MEAERGFSSHRNREEEEKSPLFVYIAEVEKAIGSGSRLTLRLKGTYRSLISISLNSQI